MSRDGFPRGDRHEEPELTERMGWESRRIAEEHFNVHKINEVLLREMSL